MNMVITLLFMAALVWGTGQTREEVVVINPPVRPAPEVAADVADETAAAEVVVNITFSPASETNPVVKKRELPGVFTSKTRTAKTFDDDAAKTEMKASATRLTATIDERLSEFVAGSKKFTVLERDEDSEEPGLGENDCAVLVQLGNFTDRRGRREVNGRAQNVRIFQLSGNVKIVGGPNAKTLSESAITVEVDANPTQQPATLEIMLPMLAREFAAQCYGKLLDVKYPMMVIDSADGVITINRGGDFLKVGDKVELFAKARVIVDEDTGDEMAIKGKPLGKATITSVEPAYSQAKADGAFEAPNGAEVRKSKE